MRILVIGATGVLGRNVVPRLVERGHAVRAVVRHPDQAESLQRIGIEAAPGDILDAASLARAAVDCDAVLHIATSIPTRQGNGDWALNDRIRREGTANLVAAAADAGARRYVQQSIVMLYGDGGDRILDEDTPVSPVPRISSAADMECAVRESRLEWCILRGGAFYGPGTGAEEGWREAARAGSLALPASGAAYLSLIHVADMARAVVLAAESAPAGSLYNVVDDEPVTYRTLYGYVAAQIGAPEPAAAGAPQPSRRCSNARLKSALAWSPAYPSFRSGLA